MREENERLQDNGVASDPEQAPPLETAIPLPEPATQRDAALDRNGVISVRSHLSL
jgi:hypothetical protein